MNTLYEKCKKVYGAKQLALVEKAIRFCIEVHEGQLRESGEPYYIHPAAVANMIFDMQMDHETVIASLLHDVVEDGKDITVDLIAREFGKSIATMVDGVTKLTKSDFNEIASKKDQQAENLRKLFLAIANDVRVVIIKLADRLHNMRTLEYCEPSKRVRKAKETLSVYAPLAHRFGMGAIKCELEDLSFMYLYPDEYEKLRAQVEPQQTMRLEMLDTAMETIRQQLEKSQIQGEVNGRPKHMYSIYRKMLRQNSTLDEIYDLIATRIIVDNVNDCYAALGIIHSIWKPVPGRFKDYIAMPKTNMYRSLHTTIFSDLGMPMEVQIRTREMHRVAEYGIAAHWMYKEGRGEQDDLDNKLGWLRQALSYESDTENTREFIDSVMKDFFSEYVFVLTPRGEVLDLPAGSTPLDFAYRIHTNVGHHCQHAKVNGAMARLDYKLRTNDVVEIITSANQAGPSRDWLNIVKTQQAKSKIRQWFKRANREENIQKGREMLEESARRQGRQLSVLMKSEYYNQVLKRLNLSSLDDLYATIGYGGISAGQVVHKLMDIDRKETKAAEILERLKDKPGETNENKAAVPGKGIIVQGDPGMVVRFAQCCAPLPGDDIIGYITRGRGVSIHRKDCTNVANLNHEIGRMISVEWPTNEKLSYTAHVSVVATDRPGILIDISQLILNMNISLKTVNAKSEKNGNASIQLAFDVTDTQQLNSVIKNIKKVKGISEVYRINV